MNISNQTYKKLAIPYFKETLKSAIAKRWAREKDWTVEYAYEVLRNFRMGIQDH